MLSRSLPLIPLAVLVLACSSGPSAAALPTAREDSGRSFEEILAALEPLEADWARLLESLDASPSSTAPLVTDLSPALGQALRRLEPALARGELSPHRAGAGLSAVVREAARRAGARPAELSRLETSLRDRLPPLLESALALEPPTRLSIPGDDLTAAELATLLGPARTRDREAMRERYCELRPEDCRNLPERLLESVLVRLVRESLGAGLPEDVALELSASLAPATAGSPR